MLSLLELFKLFGLLNLLHLELDVCWLFFLEKIFIVFIFIFGLLLLEVRVGIFAEDKVLRSCEFPGATEHR
jgi:hypothetical protein